MSGLIAVPCRPDSARYVDFYRTLNKINLPDDWEIEYYPGFFPDFSINHGVRDALKKNKDYLFIIDDDMIVAPTMLEKLLKHRVDIVCCNLLFRIPPFNPYLFTHIAPNGLPVMGVLGDKTGLWEVASVHTGGLLINTEVFRRVKEPWFSTNERLKTYDLYFSENARMYGYKMYYDFDTVAGHIVMGVVWPNRVNGEWQTSVVISDSLVVPLPPAIIKDNMIVMGEGKSHGPVFANRESGAATR